ncbi:MAG TPA: SCO family protein [Stellaceae bacterium]|nr:SCO family protein [Stellaceae bacterium]
MRSFRRLYALPIVAALCLLGVAFAAMWWREGREMLDSASKVTMPAIGGPFTLTATDGSKVTDQTYRGKIELIYFGYTYCPDACPTALNEIAGALAALGPSAERVQPLFITIDPARDTPKVLADYVRAFDPRIVGLTGTPDEIAAAANAYRVYYAPYKSADAPDGYLMDHTSIVYVMNEQGRFVASFTHETTADQMAERLRKLIAKTS